MITKYRYLPIIFIFNFFTMAFADNLASICSYATKNNPHYLARYAASQVKMDQEDEAISAFRPQLSFNQETIYQNNTYHLSALKIPVTISDAGTIHNYNFDVKQLVFDYQAWQKFLATKVLKHVALLKLQAEKQNILFNTSESYLKTLALLQQKKAIGVQMKLLQRQLKATLTKKKKGWATRLNVNEIHTQLQMNQAAQVANQGQTRVMLNQLAMQAGKKIVSLSPLFTPSKIRLLHLGSEAAWQKQALAGNFLLRTARLELKAAQHNISMQRGGHLPIVYLNVGYHHTNDIVPVFGRVNLNGFDAVIGLEVPLFSGGYHFSKTAEAIHKRQQIYYDYQAAYLDIKHGTMAIFSELVTLNHKLVADQTALKTAKETVKAANNAFNLGLRDIDQVLHADHTLYQASNQYQSDVYRYILLQLKLRRLSGELTQHYIEKINRLFHGEVTI